MLLRAQNRPRSRDTDVPNKVSCIEVIVLHGIAGDESPCSTEPSLTMNCDCPLFVFDNIKEFIDNLNTGCSAISEEQVLVLNAIVGKA